ncbi:hypothetical protein [Flavobacterium sp. UBA6135]|uniref:hypothetical protein n=1 Tax=Flavobacterium sp. UBA6135 TaxID=1946553 RepID=UPI0025C72AE0|nr:hypothetical protein [Flavobacterium sp. UBA6135]
MKKHYFSIVSILLLLLSLIAFSDNLITDVGQESNSDPKFIIHGLFMFAWFIIFVFQSNFIRKGDYKAHMKWGIAGMLVAIGVFLSTVYVFITVYKGLDSMPYFAKANRFFMLSFAVLVVLGYLNRQNGTKHKRFIYMASLLILEPILSRVSGNLHIDNVEAFIAIVWNGLFISLFVYDWLTLKKIHKISWIGFVWFYIVWTISILI